jgi:uncharacterized protein involved in response to NO
MNIAAASVSPSARKPVLFSYGFRPFFLLAGLAALINMAVWLCVYFHPSLWPEHAVPAMYWHAHEMLFGFAAAAIGGFLLTAVPNWTGQKSCSGLPLICLTGLWLAGRIAMAPLGVLAPVAASAIDLAFFPALILVLAPPLVRARKQRNLMFVGLLTVLFLANLVFHLGVDGVFPAGEYIGLGIALDIVSLLIVIIGGRIIPAFTKGGMARHGIVISIPPNKWLEIFSIASIVAVLAGDMAMPLSPWNGLVALTAALAQALRLAQWQRHRTARDPLVWVLHVGYAWLVVGLGLKAVWLLTALPFAEKWIHALTIGAFTTMILAVMTRASLGHSGRTLVAPPGIPACYGLVTIAALIRVFAPALFPDRYDEIVAISGILWIAAFGIYLFVYAPILAGPRADGKPG